MQPHYSNNDNAIVMVTFRSGQKPKRSGEHFSIFQNSVSVKHLQPNALGVAV